MAWVLFAQQNTEKTAKRNSIINFYFVTSFYSLYDICMIGNDDTKKNGAALLIRTAPSKEL